MHRRGFTRVSALLPAAAGLLLFSLCAAPAHAAQNWNVALCIARKTNASFNGVTVNGQMNDTDVAAIKKSFQEYAPALVNKLSGGPSELDHIGIRWDGRYASVGTLKAGRRQAQRLGHLVELLF